MTKVILPTLIFKEPLSIKQQVFRIKEYGADGIEVRRERLKNISTELEIFKHSIEASDLDTVIYSVPTELWKDCDSLNPAALISIKEAELLQATHIKFSLGKFNANHANADTFIAWLDANLPRGMKILIENDQSTYGGTLRPVLSFFQWAKGTSISMTFDVGNWNVNEEDWREAYHSLHPWIEYLHLKSVKKSKEGWESTPLSNEHLEIPFPLYTAIEFPLTDPSSEGPQWVTKLRNKVDGSASLI
ncbi:MAG: sugar phosphate isomerase/epimerase family protein [Bacillota bacterium]